MTNQKTEGTLKTEPRVGGKTPPEEKTLLEWEAPGRPFKKRGREYFTTVGMIVVLLAIIFLFLRDFLVIGVILALAFVVYVLATVPPDMVETKITTRGVTSAGHTYLWEKLVSFWFSEKYGKKILNLETNLGFPARVMILLNGADEAEVKKILSSYISFKEQPPTSWLDDAAEYLARKISLGK